MCTGRLFQSVSLVTRKFLIWGTVCESINRHMEYIDFCTDMQQGSLEQGKSSKRRKTLLHDELNLSI